MHAGDMIGLARDNLSRARLRTTLTAIGVAIGVAAVVSLVAFGNGFEAMAVRHASSYGQVTDVQVLPFTAATTKSSHAQTHPLTTTTLHAILALPHITGVSTRVTTPPLRLSLGGRSIDLGSIAQTPLTEGYTLVAGPASGNIENDGVLVPASALRQLGQPDSSAIGRQVTLTAGGGVCCSTNGNTLVVFGPDRHFAARIAGVYDDSGLASDRVAPLLVSSSLGATIDSRLRGISTAQYLATQGYSAFMAHSDDARQTSNVASKIQAMGYYTRDEQYWLDQVSLVFTIIKAGLAAIGGIALLVAAIGIANTMIMTILERTREIGIMKALGAEPGTVRTLFLVETALVGLIGGAAGIVLAALGSVVGNAVFSRWLKTQNVNPGSDKLFLIPIDLVGGALLLAIVVSLIAGFWPSRRALRLDPLAALRYE